MIQSNREMSNHFTKISITQKLFGSKRYKFSTHQKIQSSKMTHSLRVSGNYGLIMTDTIPNLYRLRNVLQNL